jgi:hypothetical protein
MAKIQLRNNREHDITIHALMGAIPVSVTIPGARQNADDARTPIPGVGEIEEDVLQEAGKSLAVQAMFAEKWLEPVKAAGVPEAKVKG